MAAAKAIIQPITSIQPDWPSTNRSPVDIDRS
jgi:hypothetical protein